MTLLLALMLIVGLKLSFWWLVPAVIIFFVGMNIKDNNMETISKNQKIISNQLDDLKKN